MEIVVKHYANPFGFTLLLKIHLQLYQHGQFIDAFVKFCGQN